MQGMLTVSEIRRDRLEELIEKHGGRLADLNEALGYARTETKLARIRNANVRADRGGKPFLMGDALAREIEEKLGLERGWMDNAPGTEPEITPTGRHVLDLFKHIPEADRSKAIRLLAALAEPEESAATGTDGK